MFVAADVPYFTCVAFFASSFAAIPGKKSVSSYLISDAVLGDVVLPAFVTVAPREDCIVLPAFVTVGPTGRCPYANIGLHPPFACKPQQVETSIPVSCTLLRC